LKDPFAACAQGRNGEHLRDADEREFCGASNGDVRSNFNDDDETLPFPKTLTSKVVMSILPAAELSVFLNCVVGADVAVGTAVDGTGRSG
jgi:hypothetical protein